MIYILVTGGLLNSRIIPIPLSTPLAWFDQAHAAGIDYEILSVVY